METITEMAGHIEALRELLQDFDLSVHNDEGNPDMIQQATAALDALDSHVQDLVI